MCGRFTLTTSGETLKALFDIGDSLDLHPRYNIAPTQPVVVVKAGEGARRAEEARWGLVPPGAGDLSVGARMINARSETAHRLPAFRRAFRRQRCLVPADGWYEWTKGSKTRDPWRFHLPDGRPFGMAGLYEHWEAPDGTLVQTCTVLTMDAADWGAHIHDRMPVILDPADYAPWLDPELTDPGLVSGLIRPWGGATFAIDPVRHEVNSVRNDDPRCIEPRPVQQSLL